jgi:fumarate reductase subunit C
MSARRPYLKPQRPGWWMDNSFFRLYMLREATALFALLYCALLITGLYSLSQGETAWHAWLSALTHPVCITFHCLALAAVLYHTLTWFRLAPKIMVVRIGDWTLPQKSMLIGQWLGFAACSTILLFVLLWMEGPVQ